MRIKLYKYTPHIEFFIKNPMLRATSANDLNDPFELNPSQGLIDFVIQKNKPSSDVMLLLENEKRYVDFKMSWNKGIVSLSGCKDNLLMWSHYSNEHKGGVIEFTFEIELERHSRTPVQRGFFKTLADNNYQYGEVKYKKNRTIDTSMLDGEGYKLTSQIIDRLAFVKSNDWMYEEEHRFLVDQSYCDVTLIEDTQEAREELIRLGVSIDFIGDKLAIPPNHKMISSNSFMPNCNSFTDRKKYMQFTAIKESCVTGIYFGTKLSQDKLDNILNLNEELSKFTNLNGNLYKSVIHSSRYDLDFERL
jgi:hypothetical protein